jgi:hypothetical protein
MRKWKVRKTHIFVAVILGIVLLFIAGGFYVLRVTANLYPPLSPAADKPTNVESFVKVAGIGLTLLAAIMTALVTLLNSYMQAALSRELEGIKPLLTLQFGAYKELNAAAVGLFDTLSRLQNGQYAKSLGAAADQKMTEASPHVLFTPKPYRDSWVMFQWEARRAKEAADSLIDALGNGQPGWALEIRDDNGNVVYTKTFTTQSEMWGEFHARINSALENIADHTPH